MKPPALKVFLFAMLLTCAAAQAQTPDPIDLFNKGMNAISGTPANRSHFQAVDYLRRSAELGYAPAQVVMGYLYEYGNLVGANLTDAASWYKKAAQQGDPVALWVLGRMFMTGSGVVRDAAEAEKWLLQSAQQGNPFGEYLLGLVRETRADYGTAPEWFRKAAEQGLPFAQQKLGLALKDGRGIAADRYEAYVWLLLSYESGLESSGTYVNELEGQFSSAQVESAKNEVRDRKDRYSRALVANGCTRWRGELDELPATPPPAIQRLCRQ